jgi:hypothetical protein
MIEEVLFGIVAEPVEYHIHPSPKEKRQVLPYKLVKHPTEQLYAITHETDAFTEEAWKNCRTYVVSVTKDRYIYISRVIVNIKGGRRLYDEEDIRFVEDIPKGLRSYTEEECTHRERLNEAWIRREKKSSAYHIRIIAPSREDLILFLKEKIKEYQEADAYVVHEKVPPIDTLLPSSRMTPRMREAYRLQEYERQLGLENLYEGA